MDRPPVVIAVIGACGHVGRVATSKLATLVGPLLRVGARELSSAALLIEHLGAASSEPMKIDVYDEVSLREFCAGCTVIVNCAGPSHLIGVRVARAARDAKAHYVDASADQALYQRVAALQFKAANRSAIIGAGIQPGLSEVLPRHIARGFEAGGTLTVHAGGLDHMTDTAAEDYIRLLSSDFGAINTVWDHRRRISVPSGTLRSTQLPFFPSEATAVPFLSHDAVRISNQLGLNGLQWYTVFVGRHMRETLSAAQLQDSSDDVATTARKLTRAAELDLFGHQSYQMFALEFRGSVNGEPRHRTLLCRGRSATELTGLMVAQTTLQVLDDTTPPGVSFASDVLASDRVISWLTAIGAIVMTELEDSPPTLGLELETGTVS